MISTGETYTKACPTCNNTIYYSRKDNLVDSIKKNRECRKCSKKGQRPAFMKDGIPQYVLDNLKKYSFKKGQRPSNADIRKGKTYEELYGPEKAKEYKGKIAAYKRSPESNEKRSITCKKSGCGTYNKGKATPKDVKLKISEKMKLRVLSEEHKTKIRLSNLEYIQKCLALNGNKMTPRFNIKACYLFDEIAKEKSIHIQHALNGGEYYVKELGYWVDGYDSANNVVYEYDEKHHFDIDGNINKKDLIRQESIKMVLNCEFIRISYLDII